MRAKKKTLGMAALFLSLPLCLALSTAAVAQEAKPVQPAPKAEEPKKADPSAEKAAEKAITYHITVGGVT